MLIKPLTDEGDDVVLIRVTATGHKEGSHKIIQYQCIDYQDKKASLTAMMRTTAFPAAIILQMLIRKDVTDQGVLRQELSVPSGKFIKELEKRKIFFEKQD